MSRWIYLIPVLAFGLIAGFLFKSLFAPPPEVLPSVLIDKPAPEIGLPPIDARTPGFIRTDLTSGHVTVVNFFASWCVPCRSESAQLMTLAKTPGLSVYGVDYEEHAAGAGRAFLDALGNPFSRIVDDARGRAGIDWGVYGVPETYVVDGKGIVRFKLVGPLTDDVLRDQLMPEIEKARLAS